MTGWKLSRNDIGVVVKAQVVAEISRQSAKDVAEQTFEEIEGPMDRAIDRLHEGSLQDAKAALEEQLHKAGEVV